MKNVIYEIVRNNRKGYSYQNEKLKCSSCDSCTTRYVKIKTANILLCRNCLNNLDKILADDLLKDTNK